MIASWYEGSMLQNKHATNDTQRRKLKDFPSHSWTDHKFEQWQTFSLEIQWRPAPYCVANTFAYVCLYREGLHWHWNRFLWSSSMQFLNFIDLLAFPCQEAFIPTRSGYDSVGGNWIPSLNRILEHTSYLLGSSVWDHVFLYLCNRTA